MYVLTVTYKLYHVDRCKGYLHLCTDSARQT